MRKWIETTGRSEEDAISAALFQLGLDRDDVSIEVIDRAKAGFLGFGSNPAKVRVSYEVEGEESAPMPTKEPVSPLIQQPEVAQPAPQPVAQAQPDDGQPVQEETILSAKPGMNPPRQQQARPQQRPAPRPRGNDHGRLQEGDEVLIGGSRSATRKEVELTAPAPDDERAKKIASFLTGLMEHMNVQAVPEVYAAGEDGYKIILQGSNLGTIIGRRGETLDAIQQLTNYSVNHGQARRVRVHIDAEGYRAKREDSLERLAEKVAGKVVKYRKSMTLEAMNAYERHVIHTALQDYPNVATHSTGVEPNRRTVISYTPGHQ